MKRVFLLSPANCNGLRAQWVLKKTSRSDLSRRLHSTGAPLGEVFSFLSALYFRGKLAYAQAFAEPPSTCAGVWIITPTEGLLPHGTMIRAARLRGFSRGRIHLKNPLYRSSLRRSGNALANQVGSDCELVFLGSLATGKYLEILRPIFGDRLRVPEEFIGLGDMSRGGLLLRCVRDNQQLRYINAVSASAIVAEQLHPKKRKARSLPKHMKLPEHKLAGY
ncbi:MAG TPA: hypothetical protein VIH18_15690 [Candidatus Binatia bacterium]|jgi:hypothetical protein